jgi:hypothetical protein
MIVPLLQILAIMMVFVLHISAKVQRIVLLIVDQPTVTGMVRVKEKMEKTLQLVQRIVDVIPMETVRVGAMKTIQTVPAIAPILIVIKMVFVIQWMVKH